MASVGLASFFGVLGLLFGDDAGLLLIGLPILVVVAATFLPLSTFGNLIAGWLAAGFLVTFVVVTAGGVGGYFVPATLTMLAAAVSITPMSSLLEQVRAGWRSRLRNPDERLGLDAEQNPR